jgi:CheY-like chemotaxis protein
VTKPAPTVGLSGCKVLIADDNLANRAVLQTLLESEGAECGLAADGLQAVEAWATGEWHVILMDIHMPRLDGLAAVRQIRAMERADAMTRTPVIAVTASVMADEIRRYMGAGMDAVVAKPVQFETLLGLIDQVVREPAARKGDASSLAGWPV